MHRILKLVFVLSIAFGLSACSLTDWEQTRRKGARVVVDAVDVDWSVTRDIDRADEGVEYALFVFTRTFEDKVMPAHLTLDQRINHAQRAVTAHPRCNWAGFDAEINRREANRFGLFDDVLVAGVRC